MNIMDQARTNTIKTLFELGEKFQKDTGLHPAYILGITPQDWHEKIYCCIADGQPYPNLVKTAMPFEECVTMINWLGLEVQVSVKANPEDYAFQVKNVTQNRAMN